MINPKKSSLQSYKLSAIIPVPSNENPIATRDITINASTSIEITDIPFPFLLIVLEGEISLGINLHNHSLSNRQIAALHQRMKITRFQTETETKLRILAYNANLMSHLATDFTEYIPALIKSDPKGVIRPSADEFNTILLWIELLNRQTKLPGATTNHRITEYLMTSLHLQIIEIAINNANRTAPRRSRREELMAQFLMALGQHVRSERSVNFYASMLCVSPKHLSATIKSITGDTATHFITRHVITEAKIMLRSSNHTIQEISAMLNFPNQSFFGKYFKKTTGISPNTYRQHHRNDPI